MTWVAAAVIGGSVIGAGASLIGSNQAAGASQEATNTSTAEQRRQYDQTRQDFAAQRGLGIGATDQLARLYGYGNPTQLAGASAAQQPVQVGNSQLPAGTTTRAAGNGWYDVLTSDGTNVGVLRPGGANGQFVSNGTAIPANNTPNASAPVSTGTGQPDMGAFFESPDYQFNLQQTMQAGNNSLVARGRGLSGAASKELARYGSGVASSEYGNFTNRLMQMAGLGSAATQSTAAAGQNMVNNNSAALMQNGQARASSYMTAAEGVNNAAQGGIGNYLLSNYLKK
jgi:hypothetical protein